MKKLLAVLCLMLCLCCAAALAETAQVTTPEELFAALNDKSVELVEITADMTLTQPVTINKEVVVFANVLFKPQPDDGFFVKSIEIPEGTAITVAEGGCITTQDTDGEQFASAQIYLSGGKLDVIAGSVSSDCHICFNAGVLLAPAGGFDEGVAIARYIYQGYTEKDFTEQLKQAFTEPLLREVVLQENVVLTQGITVPEDKKLTLYGCWVTLEDHIVLTGNVVGADDGSGVILMPGGDFNGTDDVPEGADCVCLIWNSETQTFDSNVAYQNTLTETLKWLLKPNGTLNITGTGAVPDLEELPWANQAKDICTVHLGEGVTGLGTGLFEGSNVTKVELPATITSIDDSAFDDLSDELMVVFVKTEGNVVRGFLHEKRIDWGEADGDKVTIREYDEDGWQDHYIVDSVYTGNANYDNNGNILRSWIDNINAEYGYDDGVLSRVFKFNADGERIYMAFSFVNDKPQFEVNYTAYRYEDDRTEVDYNGNVFGEHRVGTDVLLGQGEAQRMLSSEYKLDSGATVRCDYDEQQRYIEKQYSADGVLTRIGLYDVNYHCEKEWDITADNITAQETKDGFIITVTGEKGTDTFVICGTLIVKEDGSVQVTTIDALLAALDNESVTLVEITADMTLTQPVTLNKEVVISANLTFKAVPDEGFHVKSIEIPAGAVVTVAKGGCITTEHTFGEQIAIAQIYLSGGKLDVKDGSVADDCNLCFNAGELVPPTDGFDESVSINRYFWYDGTEAALRAAMEVEVLRGIVLQTEITLTQSLAVPQGKRLEVWSGGKLILSDGVELSGNVIADCGEILIYGSAKLDKLMWPKNGGESYDEKTNLSVPVWAEYLRAFTDDENNLIIEYDDTDDQRINYDIVDFGGSWMRMVYNDKGETIWREMFNEACERFFWVHYTKYNYTDGDDWSVDYEAFTDGKHRIGTDYMKGTGDDLLQTAGRYQLDDGTVVQEDYDEEERCMRRIYAPSGTLTEVRRIAPPPSWEVEYVWDMTDGNILVLPEDTLTIGSEAFIGVAADKIQLPEGIQSIAADAVPAGMLLLVPENSTVLSTLETGDFNYIVVK